jgi:hypothetical protein
LDNHIIGGLFLISIDKKTMRFEDFVINPNIKEKDMDIMEPIEENYRDISVWQLSTPVFGKVNQYLYEKFRYIEVSRDDNKTIR